MSPTLSLRAVSADLEDRLIAQPASMSQFFLDYRPETYPDTPLVVSTQTGKVVATFALAGDMAIFVSKDRKTLPADFVRRLAGQ